MFRLYAGAAVPMPMLPALVTTREVPVVEPTANAGAASRLLDSTESRAHGVELPIPSKPVIVGMVVADEVVAERLVPKMKFPIESWLEFDTDGKREFQPMAILFAPVVTFWPL